MGPDQAAEAVRAMDPEFAVPMHYGTMPGSKKGGEAFKKAVGGKTVVLPQEEAL
jgi:L-ascorbate metabolism protein UlaG (beta-lactamase superfamily)